MSARFDNDTIKVEGLDKLLKALKAKPPRARVGILGSNPRNAKGGKAGGPTNAEIGAAHEYGTTTIEQRSFLRVPLHDRLTKELKAAGALDKEVLKSIVTQGTLIEWLKKVAIVAEGIVLGAFDSGGYGKWPAWKNKNYTNNTGKLLVDTQQLRNSITTEVKP